jgi:CRISPR/Cas system CMR-associated protein Cmr3 (group 5 of RAMP superfamily)
MTFNNISFYKGTNAQLQISNIYRSWAEVEDESWSYWDNGTNDFAIADWNNVLMKRRDSRYVVNAGEVYNNYTGTNKIIIDDNEGIYLETDEVSVIQDAIWQNSVLPPA